MRKSLRVSAIALLGGLVFLTGCLTERQAALLAQHPGNRAFDPATIVPLEAGRTHSFAEFDGGEVQNVVLLQLAKDATLSRRYHARSDLTLFVVSGSAIVTVEDSRYFVGPGAAVVLPRCTAYSIMPHETEEDLVALLAFSPRFDGQDVLLEK